jgi:HJR/Mrr/RecB family endonuclease
MSITLNLPLSRNYANPDNDARGPYVLTDLTMSGHRPSMAYEWHGRYPPAGRSWRFTAERLRELEDKGLVVFRSGVPRLKRYLADVLKEPEAAPTILIDPSVLEPTPSLLRLYQTVNDELIAHLARRPELLHTLDPRKFEEIIADIFQDKGFTVELTPQTRDGGRDIKAVHSDEFGTSLYLVECKRYARDRKVGVEVVRGLYGVIHAERATRGIVATTSTFSRDAVKFASPLQYELSLRDFDAVQGWIQDFHRRRK